MADKQWQQFAGTIEKAPVTLWIPVAFNAASTPTLLQWNPASRTYAAAPSVGSRHGALTFVRNSTGNYTLTLPFTFQRLLEMDLTFITSANPLGLGASIRVASNPNATNALTANGMNSTSNAVTVIVEASAGGLADPAATELGIIKLTFQNSAAI